MIGGNFDLNTLAKMNEALDRVCEAAPHERETTFGSQADRPGDHQMCEKRQDHAERGDLRR